MQNNNAYNNVTPITFHASNTVNQVTYRTAEWHYDLDGNTQQPDFKVKGHHGAGISPFSTVQMEVFVRNRKSTEVFKLTREDAAALRDMFAAIAADMQ